MNKTHIARKFLILMLVFATCFSLFAQETLVVGQVLSRADQLPIPDVNIYFKNTIIGVKSDQDGYFMLKTRENVSTVIFSSIGYKTETIKLKPGQSIGIQMEMHEKTTELMDVLVIPGANPANEFMRKVRLARAINDISFDLNYRSTMIGQDLVLLGKLNQRSINQRIFEQLSKGSLSSNDSTLILPLFMSENKYEFSGTSKNLLSRNIFSSDEKNELILMGITADLDGNFNFYRNSITLLGKSIVSPLASVGNTYYRFYITDSVVKANRKEYQISFRSKNIKNLAFNGEMTFDSATLALTSIDAELPRRANINYVNQLKISQTFRTSNQQFWELDNELLTLSMTYDLLADSVRSKPELFIKKNLNLLKTSIDSIKSNGKFAQSDYDKETLETKMQNLGDTKIIKTAKWLADVIITGYVPVGKIDIGKIQNLMRLTGIEGFRLNLPVRTNETFSKHFGLSGYAGYGFKNKEVKYSAASYFSIPLPTRNVLKLSYTDDFRRIDYDYNDFVLRENPLLSGDEDISNTIFAFRSAGKLNQRKELSATASFDITDDIESNIIYRSNNLYASDNLKFNQNNNLIDNLYQQSLTLLARFSFDERVYDDHFNRIYVSNYKPVFYSIVEAGNYKVGAKSGQYLKLSGIVKQQLRFGLGQWNYIFEAGKILGHVPYLMLEIPSGTETMGYKRYTYSSMSYMEYAADQYLSMHNELIFNGFVLNNIPLLKHLNLREMLSMKLFYGGLNKEHTNILDYPTNLYTTSKPYVEVGVGVSNIFRLFTLQSVWRLTDNNHPGAAPWGLRGSIRVSF